MPWTPLRRQRNQFFVPGCHCCGSGVACLLCAAAPVQWVLSVSGVSNLSCSLCDVWNGDWTLTNDPILFGGGSPCAWSTPVDAAPAPCLGGCSACSRWRLTLTSAADLIADGGMAAYSLPLEDFDCLGPNTLTLVDFNSECDWPPTLSLSPA